MKYATEETVCLGDKVIISGLGRGTVAAIISDGVYSSSFPKEEWGYLGCGILISTNEAGVIHFKDLNSDILFFERS